MQLQYFLTKSKDSWQKKAHQPRYEIALNSFRALVAAIAPAAPTAVAAPAVAAVHAAVTAAATGVQDAVDKARGYREGINVSVNIANCTVCVHDAVFAVRASRTSAAAHGISDATVAPPQKNLDSTIKIAQRAISYAKNTFTALTGVADAAERATTAITAVVAAALADPAASPEERITADAVRTAVDQIADPVASARTVVAAADTRIKHAREAIDAATKIPDTAAAVAAETAAAKAVTRTDVEAAAKAADEPAHTARAAAVQTADATVTDAFAAIGSTTAAAITAVNTAVMTAIRAEQTLQIMIALRKARESAPLEGIDEKVKDLALISAVANENFEVAKRLANDALKRPLSRNLQLIMLIVAFKGNDEGLKKEILDTILTRIPSFKLSSEDFSNLNQVFFGCYKDPLQPESDKYLSPLLMRVIDDHREELGDRVTIDASLELAPDLFKTAILGDCLQIATAAFKCMGNRHQQKREISKILTSKPTGHEQLFTWMKAQPVDTTFAQIIQDLIDSLLDDRVPENDKRIQQLRTLEVPALASMILQNVKESFMNGWIEALLERPLDEKVELQKLLLIMAHIGFYSAYKSRILKKLSKPLITRPEDLRLIVAKQDLSDKLKEAVEANREALCTENIVSPSAFPPI